MHTHFYSGQEGYQGSKLRGSPADIGRKPIYGIYNSYYRIRGILVPISDAPAIEE